MPTPSEPLPREALNPWKCATCGKHHPIPSLARDCEKKHEKEVA